MTNNVIVLDTKWEYEISAEAIKLKVERIQDRNAIEGVFQYLSERYSKNGNPIIQSPGWEIKQISYGKRSKEGSVYLDDVYNSLSDNSFVNGASQFKFYMTNHVKRPGYKGDFITFILKPIE